MSIFRLRDRLQPLLEVRITWRSYPRQKHRSRCSSLHNRCDANSTPNEGFGEARLCRLPIRGCYLGGHLYIGSRLGVGNSAVISNGNRCLRIDEFNPIDFMTGSKSIPEGSRIFLSKAGENAIKPTDGLGKSHESCCFDGGFPDQIDRVTVVLDAAPSSRGEGKRFPPPLPRLYDFAHSKSRTRDMEKFWHAGLMSSERATRKVRLFAAAVLLRCTTTVLHGKPDPVLILAGACHGGRNGHARLHLSCHWRGSLHGH
jgi:hypothetical protein